MMAVTAIEEFLNKKSTLELSQKPANILPYPIPKLPTCVPQFKNQSRNG
jgi:hypothetical protein